MSEAIEGDYKGTPMLIIRNTKEDRFPFQFGIRKARLIVEHLDDIREFIARHTEKD